jgi:RNA-directed DNA polymerase
MAACADWVSPTVTDRLIQQALLQVLQPLIDPSFSEHSYGFRPGRRAHDAVLAAQRYVQEGRRIVVDVDLAQFFDNLPHDLLLKAVREDVKCNWALLYIERWLTAPMEKNAEVIERTRGTPQRGAWSAQSYRISSCITRLMSG